MRNPIENLKRGSLDDEIAFAKVFGIVAREYPCHRSMVEAITLTGKVFAHHNIVVSSEWLNKVGVKISRLNRYKNLTGLRNKDLIRVTVARYLIDNETVIPPIVLGALLNGLSQKLRRSSKDRFPKWMIADRLQRQNNQCRWKISPDCPGSLTMKTAVGDHILAVSRGGPTNLDNCAASCGPCNRQKSAKSLYECLKEMK